MNVLKELNEVDLNDYDKRLYIQIKDKKGRKHLRMAKNLLVLIHEDHKDCKICKSLKDILVNNSAFGFLLGSSLYTPCTFVAFISNWASSSEALKAAQVSVVKKGLPVPPASITALPCSR